MVVKKPRDIKKPGSDHGGEWKFPMGSDLPKSSIAQFPKEWNLHIAHEVLVYPLVN